MGAAVFVTEFGNDPRWDPLILANELAEQERHLVGFAFWTWKENCAVNGNSWGIYDPIDCQHDLASPKPVSGCVRRARAQMLERVYPVASADPNLAYRYDARTGAFILRATSRFGDGPTVVSIPPDVRGAVSVSGAVAGEPVVSESTSGRTVTVYPGGGQFSIEVAAAPLRPAAAC